MLLSTKKDTQLKAMCLKCWHLLIFPGSFPPSIFSASELNFCVRNGNRWTLAAINTNFSGVPIGTIYQIAYAI